MTAMMLAGVLLLAYGPSAVLILGYLSRRSSLLVLTITSAFVWLLSLFVTSLIWLAIPPLRTTHGFTMTIGVLSAEGFRAGLLALYVKWEHAANRLLSRKSVPMFNDLTAAIAAGVGYGTMQTVMMYGGMLGGASSEATFYIPSCTAMSFFTATAITALFYNLLHVGLMIIALDAWRRRSWPRGVAVFALHFAFALISLSYDDAGGCTTVLPVLAALVVVTAWGAALVVRAPDYAAKKQAPALTHSHAAGGGETVTVTSPRRR